jgi:3-deoxy-7-phosphoheptulonate synthase
MLIETRGDATPHQVDRIRTEVEGQGLRTEVVAGFPPTLILALPEPGEAPRGVDPEAVAALPGVLRLTPVPGTTPRVARLAPEHATRVRVGGEAGQVVGGETLVLAAGPCSVEGEAMLLETARAVRAAGAGILRGGAFKPRTSPYAFQGLGAEGLELLARAREETGMAVVTEVMDPREAELVASRADMLQVGARNMQNFALLREVGMLRRPVLLKRGASATLAELLHAAEHLAAAGARDIVLCERGIRTFETATRSTLDLSSVPVLRRETHLPVLVDPSHAAGVAHLVAPLALAAVAVGADGLIVEVHPDPERARSDGPQSLTPAAFAALVERLRPVAEAVGRKMPAPAGSGAPARPRSRVRGAA